MNYNIEVTAFEKSLMEIESIFTKNGALNEHIYSLPPTLKKKLDKLPYKNNHRPLLKQIVPLV